MFWGTAEAPNYFRGHVQDYDAATGAHTVLYFSDGETIKDAAVAALQPLHPEEGAVTDAQRAQIQG